MRSHTCPATAVIDAKLLSMMVQNWNTISPLNADIFRPVFRLAALQGWGYRRRIHGRGRQIEHRRDTRAWLSAWCLGWHARSLTNSSVKPKHRTENPHAPREVGLPPQEEEVVAKADVVRQRSQELCASTVTCINGQASYLTATRQIVE